ncbi:MAG: ferredoxin reductase domain-containing protein [Planctomycetota bacterium]|jgi:ferredoxin--NADP+ reductase
MSTVSTEHDPVLPDAKMNLVPPTKPVTGRIVSNDSCLYGKSSSFVRHTAIDVSGTPLAGSFLAGQSFGVIAPGVDAKGKPHKVRLYSISTPSWGDDGEGNVLATSCKRTIDEYQAQKSGDDPDAHHLFLGVCSNYMCDLQPGAEIQVSGPNGKRFLLPVNTDEHDYLFLATGTGIAPYRGMIMELLERPGGPCPSRVHLVMGTPYTTDLIYHDEFLALAAKHDNFQYDWAISREPRAGSTRGIYVDRLLEEQLEVFGPMLENPRTLVYICGLIGMQNGLYKVFARHGLAESYLTIKDELADVPPDDWKHDQIRRYIRSTARCMVEVY